MVVRRPRRKLMFVTGASGFVGRHLLRSDAARRWEVIAPPSDVLDVRDVDAVVAQVRDWRPTAVVHLAYRRDDRRSIVEASAAVARAAAVVRARLVHVSTDVVFGGRPRPYDEDDPVSPATDYGRWKAEAEALVADACPGASIVRTSLVYGTTELSPIQRDVELALTGRSTMSFFTDEVRCPVHADDLARALVRLAERRELTGPIHVAGPEALDRATFARLVARWLGLDAAALRTGTIAESGMARPARIVLDTSRATSLGLTCRPASTALAPPSRHFA